MYFTKMVSEDPRFINLDSSCLSNMILFISHIYNITYDTIPLPFLSSWTIQQPERIPDQDSFVENFQKYHGCISAPIGSLDAHCYDLSSQWVPRLFMAKKMKVM